MKATEVNIGEQYTYQRHRKHGLPQDVTVVWKTNSRTRFSKWYYGLNQTQFANIKKTLDLNIDATYRFEVCDENANVAFITKTPWGTTDYEIRLVNARWLTEQFAETGDRA